MVLCTEQKKRNLIILILKYFYVTLVLFKCPQFPYPDCISRALVVFFKRGVVSTEDVRGRVVYLTFVQNRK